MIRVYPSALARLPWLVAIYILMPMGCTEQFPVGRANSAPPSTTVLPLRIVSESTVMLQTAVGFAAGPVPWLSLPGSEVAVLVNCDLPGSNPTISQNHDLVWLGCQSTAANPNLGLMVGWAEPTLTEVQRPGGEVVPQVTLPTPHQAMVVTCGERLTPHLYHDQGTWVGCQVPSESLQTPRPNPGYRHLPQQG